ncbi:1-deoxy-D-xylulose-5-phosphate synthase [Candidatus Margulisiibacteriota bacterium]
MSETLLSNLNLPQDLKGLSNTGLVSIAAEIRQKLLDVCENCGGHLASNLGVVELTIALHKVLDSPHDKIIWDVSHQAYVHKMLTGRYSKINSLRQYGGISGFTKIDESPHDIFGTGHASTALSAALGIAQARDLQKQNFAVCAVIGDGSLSGGMSFEALNNAGRLKSNFICILNDNDMAISKPVGAMARCITQLRTSKVYTSAKETFESVFDKIPVIGVPLKRRIERTVEKIREVMLDVREGALFEEFGFRYLGPINGHNIPLLISALSYAKTYDRPLMLHVITQKGKGHAPAEKNPVYYHGVSPKSKKEKKQDMPSYTKVFGTEIVKLAKKINNLVVITPAMAEGSGLTEFSEQFPDRFFDVGIAEEHAVTFSAGLASMGLKPVLAIYSTFLQRGFDQVIHDVCLQKLPVIFAIDRAGIVGEDGPTHHGVFDYSYLLPIPNLIILAPKDGAELKQMLQWAIKQKLAVAIRYPRGSVPAQNGEISNPLTKASAEVMLDFQKSQKNKKIVIIGAGSMSWPAFEAGQELLENGYNCAVLNLRSIKPIDKKLICKYCSTADKVYVIEEGSAIGGVFYYILNQLKDQNINLTNWEQIAIPDEFITHGSSSILKNKYNLNKEGIIKKIKEEQ